VSTHAGFETVGSKESFRSVLVELGSWANVPSEESGNRGEDSIKTVVKRHARSMTVFLVILNFSLLEV
jgi:hypothetical protein